MPISAQEQNEITQLFAALSKSEASTIVASLREDSSQIGTSTSSKNYQFLIALVRMGLAREVPLEIDVPTLTSFAINDEARAELSLLLEPFFRKLPE